MAVVPVRVAFDVTPMLGQVTGVGSTTRSLFDVLAQRRDLELAAYALSLRGHGDLELLLPASMKRNRFPMPAGLLQRFWQKRPWPSIEIWTGPVDVVHGTNFVAPPTKGAALVTVHDLTAIRFPEMCQKATLQYPGLVKQAVGRGAHVHTFSQFVANEVEQLLGVDASRIHVIPAALDEPMSSPKVSTDAPRYVLALGTVEPRKNYPVLVRAFDAIADKHPETELIIAGGRGWAFEGLQAVMRETKHPKQVRYIGRVNDVERARLFAQASLLAYPSIYEGFGLPPLEAMRAGVPVVASTAGALPEVLGDAALLVAPQDEGGLAEAMDNVLSDQALHSKLVAAGATRAQMYDWKKSGDRFVGLYKELAK